MAKQPQKKQPSFKNADRKTSTSVIVAIAVLVVALAAIIVAVVALSGNRSEGDVSSASSAPAAADPDVYDIHTLESYSESYAYVQLDVHGYGSILLELDPSAAPITVANFTKLAGSGFYDGLIFHRVISGFMIQGGDPEGTGMGGSKENIKGEFSANGWENPISHTRGVISMARNSISMDSASSQFFIVHKDATYLDGQYAAFGHVVEGMDVVDAIAAVGTDSNDKPIIDVVIDRALLLQEAPKA